MVSLSFSFYQSFPFSVCLSVFLSVSLCFLTVCLFPRDVKQSVQTESICRRQITCGYWKSMKYCSPVFLLLRKCFQNSYFVKTGNNVAEFSLASVRNLNQISCYACLYVLRSLLFSKETSLLQNRESFHYLNHFPNDKF